MVGVRGQQRATRNNPVATAGIDGALAVIDAYDLFIDGYVYEKVIDDDTALAFLEKLVDEGYKVYDMRGGWQAVKWIQVDDNTSAENIIRIWLDISRLDTYPHVTPITPVPLP